MFIFGLCSISDDQQNNPRNECQPKCEKMNINQNVKIGPLSPQKCSFLDYVQFLMIVQVIQAMPPKPSKNEMFVFGLSSISDDWPGDLSDEHQPKCENRPPKSSKNEMFVFGLSSISDDWLSNSSNESQLKLEKRPLSHLQMKWLLVWQVLSYWLLVGHLHIALG